MTTPPCFATAGESGASLCLHAQDKNTLFLVPGPVTAGLAAQKPFTVFGEPVLLDPTTS